MSFLISESMSASGLISIITTASILSSYGLPLLKVEKQYMFRSMTRAIAYSSRTISELLIGFSLPLFTYTFLQNIGWIEGSLYLTCLRIINTLITYAINRHMQKKEMITEREAQLRLIKWCTSGGVIAYTMILQCRDNELIALSLYYIVMNALVFEPFINLCMLGKIVPQSIRDKFLPTPTNIDQ